MKKIMLFVLLFVSAKGFAQSKFTGTWLGTLNVGVDLRVVFHIKEDGKGGFTSTADSPDQSAYGMKCDSTIIAGNKVTIQMNNLNASFTGQLLNDSLINGSFTQQVEIPLQLIKTAQVTERIRPQTPKPPFPYKSEDLQFSNFETSLTYGATITIPEGKAPFPAIVMITGSGAQDRDETILAHKPFAVIADYLTRKGFIVLRVDDRGVGKTSGNFSASTSADFAKDVNSCVDYLLSRTEVDKTKIGLIGHSEGGMIAPMVAAKRKDINFIVLMAGPGVKIIDLMAEQNVAVLKASGMSENSAKEYKRLFGKVTNDIMNAHDSAEAVNNATTALEHEVSFMDSGVLKDFNLETTEKRKVYVVEMTKQIQSPWFRYFIRFDPAPDLEQLSCKVLAINGSKDIQVIASQNLPGIEAALKKSKSKVYEVKQLEGLNHLFQSCKKCTLDEYGELEETISPVALEKISSWLEKNIK